MSASSAAEERLGEVLREHVSDVDAESVDAPIGPEPQCRHEVRAHLGIRPVQVGLLDREAVQVPLPVVDALPRAPAECGCPVGGRFGPVRPAALAEDVPLARRGAAAGGQRLLEPDMLVGCVVGHDVDDDLDPARVERGGEASKSARVPRRGSTSR